MRSTLSSPPVRRRAGPGTPARIGAALELTLVLVGVPVGFVAGLGRRTVLHIPHPPTVAALHQLLAGSPQLLVDAIFHSLIWVVWALWAYCAFVIVLSALGQVASWIHPGGAAPVIFRMRNTIVPTSLRLVLDTVFIAAVVAPHLKTVPSVRALPPTAASVAQPAPGFGLAQVTLLAQVTTAPAPTAAESYTVKQGDTLSGIAAQECGAPARWPAIAQANAATIPDANLIHAGDIVQLPASCHAPMGTVGRDAQVHVVQPGESLWSIAEQYYGDGAQSGVIFEANSGAAVGSHGERLERPRFIEPGWRLLIPGASGSSGSAPLAGAPPRVVAPPPATAPPVGPPPSGLPSAVPAPITTASPAVTAPAPGPAGSVVSPTAPGSQAPDAPPRPADPKPAARPPLSREVAAPLGHTHGVPVRLPGGYVIPGSLAAILLGLVVRAKAKRMRDLRMDPHPIYVLKEGPVLTSIRRADVRASLDGIGPVVETVLRVWADTHAGDVPQLLACWESGESTTFLLGATGEDLPAATTVGDVEIRFEAVEGEVRAIASGPDAGRLRRGIYALGDGLLVPVGNREEEAGLHLPLLGSAIAVTGPHAARLAETMVLAAQGRCSPDDLSVVVVGGGGLVTNELGGDDTDLPLVTTVPVEQQEQLRLSLEAQLLANATTIADYGLEDFSRHALDHPDDRLPATLVVLDAALAPAWSPLLMRGRHLGLAGLVVGEWSGAERVLRLDDEGLLHVLIPGLDPQLITPCLLPETTMQELVDLVIDEPEEMAEEVEAESAHVPDAHRPAHGLAARLQLFGAMQVLDAAGNPVPQPGRGRRVTREVLAYLGSHPGWVRKETLRNALWDGEDFKDTNDQLLNAVSEARKWLVDAVTAPGGGDDESLPSVSTLPRALIAQRTGQGYRLATEYVSVDVVDFDEAFAHAKANPDSVEALRAVVDAYRGNLLSYADNPEAFTWVEQEGLQLVQHKKVAWAAIRLSEILQEGGRPDQALEVVEPLLDSILNDDLWLQAMRCEGEPAPRGLGARERVLALWGRYERHLRQLDLDPGPKPEFVYKTLLQGGHPSPEPSRPAVADPSRLLHPRVGPIDAPDGYCTEGSSDGARSVAGRRR